MASTITLSAGVRQNLLSLQNTADLMSMTQNRLATGKKVNTALDNPSNFFTSQTLSARAGDLNALLDSIGQATKTLEAADTGITALTKLVQSAKATTQQARQSPKPVTTYAPVSQNVDIASTANLGGTEHIAVATSDGPVTATSTFSGGGIVANGNLVIKVNGVNHAVALTAGQDIDAVVTQINTVLGVGGLGLINAAKDTAGTRLVLTALAPTTSYSVDATSTAQILTDTGFTAGQAGNVTSYAPAARTIANAAATYSETLGQWASTVDLSGANTVGAGHAGNLVIRVTDKSTGTTYTMNAATLNAGDNLAAVNATLAAINDGAGHDLTDYVNITDDGTNVRITTKLPTLDVDLIAGTTSDFFGAVGNTAGHSTSLLDHVGAGKQLTFTGVNGSTSYSKTVTIGTLGTGSNQVQTLAELSTWINANLGVLGGTAQLAVTNPPAGGTSITGALTLIESAGAANTVTISGDSTFSTSLKAGGITGTYNSTPTLVDLGASHTPAYDFASGGNLTISVNGQLQTVGLASGDRLSDIINKLKANATLDASLTFADDGLGHLQITAKNTDVDFSISPNTVSDALGLTVNSTTQNNKPSTSLLDLLNSKLSGNPPSGSPSSTIANGSTLTISVNGGIAQTITFGTSTGQISTFAEFQTALSGLTGITAALSGTSLNLQVPSNTVQTSLTISGSNSGAVATALGLTLGTQSGAASPTTDNAVRTNLQADYNSIIEQIDNLVKDASYNGINLLFGDDLKLVFNENGSSALNIKGVVYDSAGLGLTAVNGSNGAGFQDNDTVDLTLGRLDTALTTLRTQAGKFGSNLTTVQTRQEFTKNLINTLQTGADALVLADTNEEGANMLALQTRQQLSTTALSLANQANQAVLRLFG
jgi:hypothetical protein